MIILNQDLIEQQQLTDKDIDTLEQLHLAMSELKETPIEDISDIDEYVAQVKQLEFDMQKAWKFSEDADYHTHWFLDPKCKCPTLDNMERQGISGYIINQSCPLHGNKQN